MSNYKEKIVGIEKPVQFDRIQVPEIAISQIEVDNLIRTGEARSKFGVTGKGLTVAVLDSGLRTTHIDFIDRVKLQKNFTADNNEDENDATDKNGHGTNVTGIIAANGDHIGIAPLAEIVPIKVLNNNGQGDFYFIEKALKWINENPDLNISAICMSLGDGRNHLNDTYFSEDSISHLIQKLASKNIITTVAAGNEYFNFNSQQGMSYPAILRECISVGAVYDAFEGGFKYNGAEVIESGPDRITPFSQRLHHSVNSFCYTNVFGPGAPVTSSGINNDRGESIQHGTSQAAPVVTGVILLIQERFKNLTGKLPSVSKIKEILKNGSVNIFDGDDEYDNVLHTNLNYKRVDAFESLKSINSLITKELYVQNTEIDNLYL